MHKCGEGKEDPGIYSLRTGAKPEPVRRLDPLPETRPVPGFSPVFQIPIPAGIHFRFSLVNRIRSWHPSGRPFPSALLTFLFLVFTLNLLNLLAKWKCTCLAKTNLTITAYFPYSSAFLPLIVILYSHSPFLLITFLRFVIYVPLVELGCISFILDTCCGISSTRADLGCSSFLHQLDSS